MNPNFMLTLFALQVNPNPDYYYSQFDDPIDGCKDAYKECGKTDGVLDWAIGYKTCSNNMDSNCTKKNVAEDYNGHNIQCSYYTRTKLQCSRPYSSPCVFTVHSNVLKYPFEVKWATPTKLKHFDKDHRVIKCIYDIRGYSHQQKNALREKYNNIHKLYPDLADLNRGKLDVLNA